MDNILAGFFPVAQGWQTFWGVSLAALLFIFVNTVSHSIQEMINERRKHRLLVVSAMEPVLGAAADLISRLCEILVYQRTSMVKALARDDRPDISTAAANQLDRVQSTAFRLLRFIVLSHYFQAATADTPQRSLLRRANFFLQRKIPTAMKGGYYQVDLLPKEEQEFIAADVCDFSSYSSVLKLNIGSFSRLFKDGKIDRSAFADLVKFLIVDPGPIRDGGEMDRTSVNWRKLLALAHVAVYLIDFFQDLRNSPRWEEHRLVLVSLLRQWNSAATNPRYLYHKGDLQTDSYLDTYSERICWGRSLYALERFVPGGTGFNSYRTAFRRWVKGRVLRKRGRRYEGAHRVKIPSSAGLKLEGPEEERLIKYGKTFSEVHGAVLFYLKSEGEVFDG